MAPRTRTGVEGEGRTFRSSEGAQLSAEIPTAMSAGEEADAFDLGEGLEVEWLSSGSVLVRVPSTGSGGGGDEAGGSRLVREWTDAGLLGS